MTFLKITVLALTFAVASCCSSSKTQKNDAMEKTANAQTMVANGFTQGTIVVSSGESGCPYIISSEIDGNQVMYDPINLEEAYKKDGMSVWYKFRPLRMMNRCENANPVEISEMKEM